MSLKTCPKSSEPSPFFFNSLNLNFYVKEKVKAHDFDVVVIRWQQCAFQLETLIAKASTFRGIWALPFWSSSCYSKGKPPCCRKFLEAHTSIWHSTSRRRISMASCDASLSIFLRNVERNLQFHASINKNHFNISTSRI